ncbi:hypothetical protein [Frankia sp. AvcI1]|uniref:hypothetical protein n=2 Tax=Frankia sp. AvcI1 TaxID=573496 RepID=UPI002118C08E|nr:hypothetical protein [Frankia sp. AvcI1]
MTITDGVARAGARRSLGLALAVLLALLGAVVAVAPAARADVNQCSSNAGAAPCLVLGFTTGGDDLRGGNDNVDVTVSTTFRGARTFRTVNQGASWSNNSFHQVGLDLRALFGVSLDPSEITGVTLGTTFGGGIGGDNWNLDSFNVSYQKVALDNRITISHLYGGAGSPLFRFTHDAAVFHARIDAVGDGGFEEQPVRAVSAPWRTEGPDTKGVDRGLGLARTGPNNAFIRTASRSWNALAQDIPVRPNTNYVLRGWVRTSGHGAGADVNTGFFGVRLSGVWPPVEQQFGPSPAGQYQEIVRPFNPGDRTSVTVFCGFWGLGTDGWIQMDQISVRPVS